MSTQAFEFGFVVRLDRGDRVVGPQLRKFRQEPPILETPRSPIISVEELVYGSWQCSIDEVLQVGSDLADGGAVVKSWRSKGDISKVINSLPQWIFPKGAKLSLVEGSELSAGSTGSAGVPKPRLSQFLLTAADYAKFYVHAVELREELIIPECANRRVYSPLAIGLVSKLSHLQLPRVILAGVVAAAGGRGFLGEWSASNRRRVLGSLGYALEMRFPVAPSQTAFVWCPVNDDKVEVVVQNGNEKNMIRPLFDILPLSTILTALNVLFLEQKLVLISFRWSPSFLLALCESLRSLMYPFDWHHVYLPAHPELETLGHLHELRTFEVPAPLLASFKVLETRSESAIRNLSDAFPDINFIDVDAGLLLPATLRLDGRSGALPSLPRRILTTITTRLKGEQFGVFPPTDSTIREAWAERLSDYEAWEVGDETRILRRAMRHSSLKQLSTQMVKASATSVSVVASNPWFSGFLSKSHASEETSSSGGGLTNRLTEEDNGGEAMIHAALLDGLVRVLFLYSDFVEAKNDAGSFVGGERCFQLDEFVKELTKNSSFHGLQTGDVDWLKEFVTTQTWDLFLRTVSGSEVGRLFDEACGMFKSLSRSPKNKKNLKESFVDELNALVFRYKTPQNMVIGPRYYSGSPRPQNVQLSSISTAEPTALDDVATLLSRVGEIVRNESSSLGGHLFFRVLQYMNGTTGFGADPALVPVKMRTSSDVLVSGWQVCRLRILWTVPDTIEFESVCRGCGYATGFWKVLSMTRWAASDAKNLTFACPTCKLLITPCFRTTAGTRVVLAGLLALFDNPLVSEHTLRLLASATVIADEKEVAMLDLLRNFIGTASQFHLRPPLTSSDEESAESPLARVFSGRSVEPIIVSRVARYRAVERIRDYRSKNRKSDDDIPPVLTVRVLLESSSVPLSPPPLPRDPRPEKPAPRRPLRN